MQQSLSTKLDAEQEDAATNTVAHSSKKTKSKKNEKETGWYTQAQLSVLEACSYEDGGAFVGGLASRPSRFPHLRADPGWTETLHVHTQKRKDTHGSTLDVELKAHIEATNVDMLNSLEADLGVGDFDAGASGAGAAVPQPPAQKAKQGFANGFCNFGR